MSNRATNPTALRDFRASLPGELILPDDDGHDSARRVWNGMIDKYPAMIIRCANRADVAHAVEFGHLQHLPVAVRGGGHSVIGKSVCDGGIVIDLSQMKGIRVDPATCTARAEAGLTLGEFVRQTQPFGLVTTTGTVAGTGLAGLTLGGGLGWFMGKYGLTIDNLLAVDIVTADGQVLRASATEHPDLFWGVRGGGGNFGIVTAFALREESYVISIVAAWDGGEAERHIAWARACWRALSPFASSGVYVNFLGNEGEERVRAAYGVNYERLVALKNQYDPTNFFSLNQSIRPTVKEPRPLVQAWGVLAA